MTDPDVTSNPGPPAFVARSKWSPDRPETLVVCCSDGRWHAPIHEFVEHAVSERADLFAVPGGPAVFDPWNSSFDDCRVFDSAMQLFAEHHDIHSLWLIQHEGCSYYRLKHPQLDAAALAERQIADLRRAAEVSRAKYPGLAVRGFLATLRDGHAWFIEVDTTVPARSGFAIALPAFP